MNWRFWRKPAVQLLFKIELRSDDGRGTFGAEVGVSESLGVYVKLFPRDAEIIAPVFAEALAGAIQLAARTAESARAELGIE